MKKLYLVDVSSIFFRAFYAIPPLTNEKGLPTNAIYGFLTMTLKLLREEKPDYLAFCFDRKEPSFRLELYDQYKANRSEMPEDLIPQIPYIRKLTDVLNISAVDAEGFEADDVIGTLTRLAHNQDIEVVIVSGDKDFAQLVDGKISMYDTMKEQRYDAKAVHEKWGIRPDQMIDYLSLVGDSSDNVPGVRGIGPKGAQKLLTDFESLDGIYARIEEVSGKSLKQKLIENKEMAYLSKKLVTIRQDVPLEFPLEKLTRQPLDLARVIPFTQEMGFKSLLKTLQATADVGSSGGKSSATAAAAAAPASGASAATAPSAESEMVLTAPSSVEPVVSGREKRKNISILEFDEFMTALEPYSSVYFLETPQGLFIAHKQRMARVPVGEDHVVDRLGKKYLRHHGFNLKDVWHALGLPEPVLAFDAMLAAYVLRAGAIGSFAEVYLQKTGNMLAELAGPEDIYQAVQELEKVLLEQIKADGAEKVFNDIEIPACAVLYTMEKVGIRLDAQVLREQSVVLQKDLQKLEQDIYELCGGPFNVGSPKQLGHVLFEKLKLPTGKKTKTGYSTDSDVLEKLKGQHAVIEHLIEYRELAKIKSTYVDALPNLVNAETGRIHTSFRQAWTTTGRLSSVNPNLQNIPIRTERGRAIRKAFVAKPGSTLISADYSQIELRILAHITGDPGLVRAFQDDLDIHAATASEIFGVPLAEVTSDLRRAAKAVNFGIAYGQGAFGLAEGLGIPRKEATEIIDRYFERFKNVRSYMEETIREGYEKGYVETLFGRRRYLDELKSKNQGLKKFGERAAINAPIQGTASDLVKLAMIQIHHETAIPLLLQVHDELLFECPKNQVEQEIPLIKKVMENIFQLKVPLKVNIASGENWEDAHS